MRILITGPLLTSAVADATGIDLSGLPPATAQTPLAPLTAGLLALGHEVHLVTLDPTLDVPEQHVRGPLTITFCPIRGEPRYRARERSRDLFAREIAYLTDAIRNSSADIVHANWTYEYAEAAHRSGKPSLVTMHDLGWDYFFIFRDMYRFIRLVMKYRAMLKVRHLSVVAPFMVRKAWHYGYFGSIDVIANPILATDWAPKDPARPVIVTVGNAGRVKNVAASVAAFRIVRNSHPDAELHLFGPGLGSDGDFETGEAGVTCHGNVLHGELMAFLAERATLLVHPARIETFGVIVAEAKMRGVPVVAGGRSGGVSYVVGDTGALVDIESPQKIAAATLAFLADAGHYAEAQSTSHEDAFRRFSASAVSAKYLEVYSRIVQDGR